jgi:hypothetical protein
MEMNMNMMGQERKTTSQGVEISKKSAPAGTYSVFQGYTQQHILTTRRAM